MQIVPMRSGSQGILGTYKNARHHARNLVGMIDFFDSHISRLDKIGTWKQGHNVHELVMADGRSFILRPLWKKDEGYIGMSLSVKISRGNEFPLFNMFYDLRNNVSWQLAVDTLKATAKRKNFVPENIQKNQTV